MVDQQTRLSTKPFKTKFFIIKFIRVLLITDGFTISCGTNNTQIYVSN